MIFLNWLENEGGPVRVAEKLGVPVWQIYDWRRGKATPKALTMQKIVRLSAGQVSYDDIINATKRGGGFNAGTSKKIP